VADNAKLFQQLTAKAGAINYVMHIITMEASKYGSPQARPRLYPVLIRRDIHGSRRSFYGPSSSVLSQRTLRDIVLPVDHPDLPALRSAGHWVCIRDSTSHFLVGGASELLRAVFNRFGRGIGVSTGGALVEALVGAVVGALAGPLVGALVEALVGAVVGALWWGHALVGSWWEAWWGLGGSLGGCSNGGIGGGVGGSPARWGPRRWGPRWAAGWRGWVGEPSP
jgi:hypothetical protein